MEACGPTWISCPSFSQSLFLDEGGNEGRKDKRQWLWKPNLRFPLLLVGKRVNSSCNLRYVLFVSVNIYEIPITRHSAFCPSGYNKDGRCAGGYWDIMVIPVVKILNTSLLLGKCILPWVTPIPPSQLPGPSPAFPSPPNDSTTKLLIPSNVGEGGTCRMGFQSHILSKWVPPVKSQLVDILNVTHGKKNRHK